MEFTGKYNVKFFVFQIIFWICFQLSTQLNLRCVPLEHCPEVLSIIEDHRFSPEIMKTLVEIRCSHSKPRIFIWCSKPWNKNQNFRYPQPIESTNIINNDQKEYKQAQKSTGFIWYGKKSTNPTSSRMFTNVKPKDLNSMLSGHEFVPYFKTIPETTMKPILPQSEIEGKIYFPDENIYQIFSRRGKSKALNDLSSTCGRPFFKNSNPSFEDHSAGVGEFPWMALLEYNVSGLSVPNCAGTLISSRHVLTAANCVQNPRMNQLDLTKLFQVVLGDLNTNSLRDCVRTQFGERCGDVATRLGVESVIIHPLYSRYVGVFDLAILKLEREVEFSDFVTPICLPGTKSKFEIQNKFILASWQKDGDRDNYVLKKASVALTGSKIYPIDEPDFCTGLPGNPLMVQDSDIVNSPFYLYNIDVGGVKSKNCGGVPTSSVMVASFRNWIEENLS